MIAGNHNRKDAIPNMYCMKSGASSAVSPALNRVIRRVLRPEPPVYCWDSFQPEQPQTELPRRADTRAPWQMAFRRYFNADRFI